MSRHDIGPMGDTRRAQAAFIGTSLEAVPRWATAVIGVMVGGAVAIVFTLSVTGLQGPVLRVANAWAAKFEASGRRLEASTDRIAETSHSITAAVERFRHLESAVSAYTRLMSDAVSRLERIEAGVTDHGRRLTDVERTLRDIERARPTPRRQAQTRPAPAPGTAPGWQTTVTPAWRTTVQR